MFPLSHRLKYLAWRLSGAERPITLRMKSGALLPMRPLKHRDYGTAYDVFVIQPYNVDLQDPRVIVDLGANVGYATLYFATRYPNARIHSFEPHPVHYSLVQELIALNNLQTRVTVYPQAAGVSAHAAHLSDSRTSSQILNGSSSDGVPVQVIDFFDWARSAGVIDLLKIDIEGGEFSIFRDPRFPGLCCGSIVMEYHKTPEFPEPAEWCLARLSEAGYNAKVHSAYAPLEVGIIHATRR
jgi:FkbM family methyltransferase